LSWTWAKQKRGDRRGEDSKEENVVLPEGKMPLASALAGSFSRPACDSLYGCDAAFFSWSPALARGCDDDSHAARPSLAIMGGEPFVCNSDRQSESIANVDILTFSGLFLQALRLLIVQS
jgi:hypothetical protein